MDEARCECCGMVENCTGENVWRMRERYCGRQEPRRQTEEALAAHMGVCSRFNSVGRANPVLMQTQAMKEIMRKRGRSNSPRDSSSNSAMGGLTMSSTASRAIPMI